jgi:NADH-quinone oxidoreductase subunit M
MQFVENALWIERFNIHYHLGVDGISMWFVPLTAFITVIVVIASWTHHRARQPVHGRFPDPVGSDDRCVRVSGRHAVLRVLRSHSDPDVLIIGIWGGPNKIYAAFKFFLYTLLGSLLTLVA